MSKRSWLARCLLLLLIATGGAALRGRRTEGTEEAALRRGELRALLEMVKNATPPGARIAVIVPERDHEEGSVKYRAAYQLPGRIVVAPAEPSEFIVAFQTDVPCTPDELVFKSTSGVLCRTPIR